jgi:LPXTG-motif cell wall-anchored protein
MQGSVVVLPSSVGGIAESVDSSALPEMANSGGPISRLYLALLGATGALLAFPLGILAWRRRKSPRSS